MRRQFDDNRVNKFLAEQEAQENMPADESADGKPAPQTVESPVYERKRLTFFQKSWHLLSATFIAMTVLGVLSLSCLIRVAITHKANTRPNHPPLGVPVDVHRQYREMLENDPNVTKTEDGRYIIRTGDEVEDEATVNSGDSDAANDGKE